MKKILITLILSSISLVQFGQIVANHTIVADFDKIPANYMTEVKKMLVGFPGESHSAAYRTGMELLEALYPAYSVNVATGEAYTDQHLRVNLGAWTGEDVWYTWNAYPIASRPAASTTIKNLIKEYSDHGHPFNAIGYGWCWDMIDTYVSSTTDPVFGCRWYGKSDGGPEGNRAWGLDAADYSITGNSVSMETYLAATEDYRIYCNTNSYITKAIFTTGPVDVTDGEGGYQIHLKQEYIRNYVAANPARILFDYADILCYDDNGVQTTKSWSGHTFPSITATNLGDGSLGHIGNAGAIRLAKAQWWMLARIAGWDGSAIPTNINSSDEKTSFMKVSQNQNEIKIELDEDFISGKAVMYNNQGLLVRNTNIVSDNLVFNISSLPSGLYIVTLTKGQTVKSVKIIKP